MVKNNQFRRIVAGIATAAVFGTLACLPASAAVSTYIDDNIDSQSDSVDAGMPQYKTYEAGVYGKQSDDYAIKYGGEVIDQWFGYKGSGTLISDISAGDIIEHSFDIAISDYATSNPGYFMQLWVNKATLGGNEGLQITQDGSVIFFGHDSGVDIQPKRWYNLKYTLELSETGKAIELSMYIDNEKLKTHTYQSAMETYDFMRYHNNSGDAEKYLYIDNIVLKKTPASKITSATLSGMIDTVNRRIKLYNYPDLTAKAFLDACNNALAERADGGEIDESTLLADCNVYALGNDGEKIPYTLILDQERIYYIDDAFDNLNATSSGMNNFYTTSEGIAVHTTAGKQAVYSYETGLGGKMSDDKSMTVTVDNTTAGSVDPTVYFQLADGIDEVSTFEANVYCDGNSTVHIALDKGTSRENVILLYPDGQIYAYGQTGLSWKKNDSACWVQVAFTLNPLKGKLYLYVNDELVRTRDVSASNWGARIIPLTAAGTKSVTGIDDMRLYTGELEKSHERIYYIDDTFDKLNTTSGGTNNFYTTEEGVSIHTTAGKQAVYSYEIGLCGKPENDKSMTVTVDNTTAGDVDPTVYFQLANGIEEVSTFEARVYCDGNSTVHIALDKGTSRENVILLYPDGRIYAYGQTGRSWKKNGAARWVPVAYTLNPSNGKLYVYVDGELVRTRDVSASNWGARIIALTAAGTKSVTGIDDMRLYTGELEKYCVSYYANGEQISDVHQADSISMRISHNYCAMPILASFDSNGRLIDVAKDSENLLKLDNILTAASVKLFVWGNESTLKPIDNVITIK